MMNVPRSVGLLVALAALGPFVPFATAQQRAPTSRQAAVQPPSANFERRLKISLDSAVILVEVTSRAASIELISPCGTFLDAFDGDETLARWADAAELLPPPTPDSTDQGKFRYSAVRLHDPADRTTTQFENTTFHLVRLDTSVTPGFLLTVTNRAWGCEVALSPEQAGTLFSALRGHPAADALPIPFPPLGGPDEAGVWRQVDRPAMVQGRIPELRIPTGLVSMGATVRLTLLFVIDTTGRVRPSSIRLIGSPHPSLAQLARATLLAMRFRPAQKGGRPVPQSAAQEFRFTQPLRAPNEYPDTVPHRP